MLQPTRKMLLIGDVPGIGLELLKFPSVPQKLMVQQRENIPGGGTSISKGHADIQTDRGQVGWRSWVEPGGREKVGLKNAIGESQV